MQVVKSVLRECNKKEQQYKFKVMPHLSTLCEKLNTDSFFERICDMMLPLLHPMDDGSDEDEDDKYDQSKMLAKAAKREKAVEAGTLSALKSLENCWPSSSEALVCVHVCVAAYRIQAVAIDKAFEDIVQLLEASTWKIKRQAFATIKTLAAKVFHSPVAIPLTCYQTGDADVVTDASRLSRLNSLQALFSDAQVQQLVDAALAALGETKQSGLRKAALEFYSKLLEVAKHHSKAFPSLPALAKTTKARIIQVREDDNADVRTAGVRVEGLIDALA